MLVRDRILNLLPFGVVVVTAGGKVILSNGIARELMKTGSGIAIEDGVLTAGSKVYQKALSEAIDLASGNKARHSSGFSMVRQGLPPVSVSVLPLDNESVSGGKAGPRKALVLASDPAFQIETDLKLIARMFDFTAAEALIARHMLDGKDIDEIAQGLHLSKHTVRNHLKHLYSKTNTHKYCALLHLLLRSPAGLQVQPTKDPANSMAQITNLLATTAS